ncbi:hypothetical protein MKX03_017946 [Papaver bracteatum]|nr:hypothetical protein MKX03_017946 [Papaver bracteatum]
MLEKPGCDTIVYTELKYVGEKLGFSNVHGDHPSGPTDAINRKDSPFWEYDEEESCWKWKKPPPSSKKRVKTAREPGKKGMAQNMSIRDKVRSVSLAIANITIFQPSAKAE